MADTLSKERRSELMRRVRREGTGPELLVRRELHRRGLRYNIGDRRLPGSPDLSFPRWRVAIFIHGCFWHGHRCGMGREPASNRSYWRPKIEANRERDARKERELAALGWRVLTVWECELRDKARLPEFLDRLAERIRQGE